MDSFDNLIQEVKSRYFTARKSHDWEHTKRVYNLCMHIGKIENADLEVLKISAFLHDIGRETEDKSEGKHCHAEIGAVLAREILENYEYPKEFIDKVVHCIETHRFRGKRVPDSLEAKILFDADKLDAIGAIGIGRAFVFAGEVGAKVHNKYVDIANTKPYTEEDTAYREFKVKLIKVKDRMITQEGKRIALDRHNFMVNYFERLNQEVDGEC
ncbi:MAG: HD domain-containing protein [Deltaproteobacteria bacterium]